MMAIFGGENSTRVMVLLPSPCALSTQGGAVVRAAVVDAVHVGHQNLNTKVLLHLCYGPLKVSSEIALRKLNEQKDIFTIWENFVPGLFFSNGRISGTKQDFVKMQILLLKGEGVYYTC